MNDDEQVPEKKPPMDISKALVNAYQADYDKTKVKISGEFYTNLAWVNVSGRDVFIDFLKMPGIPEDGIPVLNGIRVYMPLAAAMRLSEVLGRSISDADKTGGFENIIEQGP